MKIINNSGPRMLPCGIPLITFIYDENLVLILTLIFLLNRKEHNVISVQSTCRTRSLSACSTIPQLRKMGAELKRGHKKTSVKGKYEAMGPQCGLQ